MEKRGNGKPQRVCGSEEVRKIKDTAGGRGCRGLEPSHAILSEETIQTRNRRQIILNGLIYDDSESEQRREENIKKLDDLLLLQQESPDKQSVQVKKVSATPKISSTKTTQPQLPPSHFAPKWDDYDIMRHRWQRYIHPQTRCLSPDPSTRGTVLPHSPHISTVRLVSRQGAGTAITGNYFDAEYFLETTGSNPRMIVPGE